MCCMYQWVVSGLAQWASSWFECMPVCARLKNIVVGAVVSAAGCLRLCITSVSGLARHTGSGVDNMPHANILDCVIDMSPLCTRARAW